MGELRVRKRGQKWYFSFEGAKVDGKRNRIERVGGCTKKEALAKGRKAMTEYENAGLFFEPAEISVADYFDYWMKNTIEITKRGNTQDNYRRIIKNHVKPTLGHYKLKSITPAILQQFVNDKSLNGYSKSHMQSIMGVVNNALKYAVHPLKFIKDNPMQYVVRPEKRINTIQDVADLDGEVVRVIPDEDYIKIIDRFPQGSNFYIPIINGYHGGLRIGEATGLTWDDIDMTNNTIDINKILIKNKKTKMWYLGPPKTKCSIRKIELGPTHAEILKEHKKWQLQNRLKYGEYYTQQYIDINNNLYQYKLSLEIPKGLTPINLLCTKENGEIVTSDSFKYAARVIHYELNLEFEFHWLRHTHATKLIENGAKIKAVQKRLGHKKSSTTEDIYVHETKKMSEETIDIFENSLPTKAN
jgi:integrase